MHPTKVAESCHGCQTDTIENNGNQSEMLEIESEFEEALKNVKETYSTPEETDEETDPKESKTLDDHSEIGILNQNLIQSEPLVYHSECDLDNPYLVSRINCLQKFLKSFPAFETRFKGKKCAKGLEREVQFERLLSDDSNKVAVGHSGSLHQKDLQSVQKADKESLSPIRSRLHPRSKGLTQTHQGQIH